MPFDPSLDWSSFRNELLLTLSAEEVAALRPHMQPVALVYRQTIHAASEPIDHVYFVESGLTSMVAETMDGGLVEVGLTGREGLVGAAAILAPDAAAVHRVVVQVPGNAIRVRAPAFREMLEHAPRFRDRCLRYVQCLLVQTSQCAACNARHEVAARLARWLLQCLDRLDGNELPTTQEFLSYMLGVRRSGVSPAINTLQAAGAIRPSRGRIAVLDRGLLESRACNCYRVIEDSRRRTLDGPRRPECLVPDIITSDSHRTNAFG